MHMKEVVIVSAVRTPIGSFLGALSSVPAPELGAVAIRGALDRIDLEPSLVQEVLMGHVVQAGAGQAPARQAAIKAGIPDTVPCTTVNKVCASGMKAVMQAAQAIALGDREIMVAGGMENMSMIPHYLHLRSGKKFGPATMEDGMQKDGLVDAYDQQAMGVCADACAAEYNFSREDQDAFAIQSYERSARAWKRWFVCRRSGPGGGPPATGRAPGGAGRRRVPECKDGKSAPAAPCLYQRRYRDSRKRIHHQ